MSHAPTIASNVPEDEQLDFLVRLFLAMEEGNFPLSQHLECAIIAVAESE